jgi:hypothetical protein
MARMRLRVPTTLLAFLSLASIIPRTSFKQFRVTLELINNTIYSFRCQVKIALFQAMKRILTCKNPRSNFTVDEEQAVS